jgi:glycosyltransferase involved in cell wall biosynthesis
MRLRALTARGRRTGGRHSGGSPGLRRVVSVNTTDRGSGAETVAWSLFKEYERRGIESWLVVGDKKSDDPRVLPFFLSPHVDYRPYARWWRQARVRWAKRLHRALGWEDFEFPYTWQLPAITGGPPDVLHCHNLHGGYFDLRALAPLSRRIPTFLTIQDAWTATGHCSSPLDCPRWETGCGRCPDLTISPAIARDATRFNWRRKAGIFRRARLHVAAPSRWLLDRVRRSLVWPGVVEARVLPCCVDLGRFRPAPKAEARAGLDLPVEGHLAVFAAYCAVSNPRKDYVTVREAFLRLGREGLAWPLHLVVAGEEGPTCRAGMVTIQHLPFLSQGELLRYLRAADLCVHAAREEVFGVVLAEAMACGTPVVATATGGIPEVVGDGRHGLLTPPGDVQAFAAGVRALVEDAARRAAYAAAAAAHARDHFDQEKIAGDYLAWFAAVRAAWDLGGAGGR